MIIRTSTLLALAAPLALWALGSCAGPERSHESHEAHDRGAHGDHGAAVVEHGALADARPEVRYYVVADT